MKKLKTPLTAECEAVDRDIRTTCGVYLATAPTDKHAKLWANSTKLLKLCERAASGQQPTQEEFAAALQDIVEPKTT